jgi:hypothetical protein
MTREERENFVRETLDRNIANAVQAIVEKWEDDVQDNRDDRYSDGFHDGQENARMG